MDKKILIFLGVLGALGIGVALALREYYTITKRRGEAFFVEFDVQSVRYIGDFFVRVYVDNIIVNTEKFSIKLGEAKRIRVRCPTNLEKGRYEVTAEIEDLYGRKIYLTAKQKLKIL